MPSPPQTHRVLITAADHARSDLEGLAKRLTAKGLDNASALSSVGIITGHAAPDVVDSLRSEPGVASVEVSGGVQIPPPDSEVQ